jgi:glycosyltransferase involved in cell wall biosynthesis
MAQSDLVQDMSDAPPAQGRAAVAQVILIGGLPPPYTGMAIVTRFVLAELERSGRVLEAINLVPDHSVGWLRMHLRQLAAVLGGALTLVRHAGRARRRLYMPCLAGETMIYMLFLGGLARILGYRILLHHHSFSYVDAGSTLMSILVRALGPHTVHILLCKCMESRFRARYGAARLLTAVLGNDLFMPRMLEDRLPAPGPVTIGHLSNLTWEKGSGVFLDLFEALLAQGADARAVLAGKAGDPTLNARIAEVAARHGDRFAHLADVTPDNRDAFLDRLDFFVFPTRYRIEAQPLVLFEARARGVPVISIDRGCIGEDHAGWPNLVVRQDEDFVAVAGRWIVERRFASPSGARQETPRDRDRELAQFLAHFD